MAADFDAKIAELAHRQTESDHAAQQGLQRLHSEARADAEAHARAVDGAHAAVNKTRAAVDALRDDVRKGFEQLQHDVTEQAHADASALVGALRVQVEEHAATAAANKEATDERMDKMTTDMNDHVEARFRDAKDSARAHVNALNQELQEVIRSLEIQVAIPSFSPVVSFLWRYSLVTYKFCFFFIVDFVIFIIPHSTVCHFCHLCAHTCCSCCL